MRGRELQAVCGVVIAVAAAITIAPLGRCDVMAKNGAAPAGELEAPPGSADPEVVEQVDALVDHLRGLLTEDWKAWQGDEIETYVGAFGDALKGGLAEPLTPDRVEALRESLAAYVKGQAGYDPGGDQFARRESCVAASVENIRWRTQVFARRPPLRTQDAAAIRRQIAQIAEAARTQGAKAYPDLKPEDIAEAAQGLAKRLERTADDVLDPSLKRPLTDKELADVLASIPGLYAEAVSQAQKRLDRMSSALSPERLRTEQERLRTQAFSGGIARLRSAVGNIGAPPSSPALVAAMEQIGKEHRELSARWHEEQREKFRAESVIHVLGSSVEPCEQVLRLFEIGVSLLRSLNPDWLSPLGGAAAGVRQAQDLSCNAEVTFWSKQYEPVTLLVQFQAKAPDKLKIVFNSRTTEARAWLDVFQSAVGAAYIVNGRDAVYYQPRYQVIDRFSLGDASQVGTITNVYGGGTMMDQLELGPYLGALFDLTQQAYYQSAQPVAASDEAAQQEVEVTELVPQAPRKPIEPHTIAKFRYYRDADTDAVVKIEALASDGSLVSTTTFSQQARVGAGRRLAMHSETVTAPGTINLSRDVALKRGEGALDTETWKAELEQAGRRIVREFRWLADYGLLVPREVRVYELPDTQLMTAVFTDYQVNWGLADSVFSVPGMSAENAVPPGE